MPDVSFEQLVGTATVTKMISRIKTPMQRFQNFLGMGPGGPARNPYGGRNFVWDIFDKSRNVAQMRAPATGPSAIAAHPIGQGSGIALRTHEKIPLLEERIFRSRPQGFQYGTVDSRGLRYVGQQTQYLGQRASNFREFAISRMLQGQLYVELNGEEWIPTDSATNADGGGNLAVDFQIPAANKERILETDGITEILTSWAYVDGTSNDPNIHSQLLKINAKYEQEHGYPLRHIWINSVMFDDIMQNYWLKNLAGTANQVFQSYTPTGLRNVEGIEDTGYAMVLRGAPQFTFHIYDGVLNVGGDGDANAKRMIPDSYPGYTDGQSAIFMPDPTPSIAEWYEGSEVVAENRMDPGMEQFGLHAWTTREIDPASFELKCLENGLPVLYLPKAICYGNIGGETP